MKRIAATVALIAAVLFSVAAPASAHTSVLSGSTECVNVNHVITWSIGNDFGLTMSITNATATLGGTNYAVTGYTTSVGVSPASTSATTTVPGNLTGTITLSVHTVWSDGFQQTNTTSVLLTVPCSEGTTTTTSTTTTTTSSTTTSTTVPPESTTTTTGPPDTTTTGPPDTTTTSTPPVSSSSSTTTSTTVPPSSTTTTLYVCTPDIPPCASTGSNTGLPIGVGLGTLVLGGSALLATRKRWSH